MYHDLQSAIKNKYQITRHTALREEFLNGEIFYMLQEATILIES